LLDALSRASSGSAYSNAERNIGRDDVEPLAEEAGARPVAVAEVSNENSIDEEVDRGTGISASTNDIGDDNIASYEEEISAEQVAGPVVGNSSVDGDSNISSDEEEISAEQVAGPVVGNSSVDGDSNIASDEEDISAEQAAGPVVGNSSVDGLESNETEQITSQGLARRIDHARASENISRESEAKVVAPATLDALQPMPDEESISSDNVGSDEDEHSVVLRPADSDDASEGPDSNADPQAHALDSRSSDDNVESDEGEPLIPP
jgi:hypothetical protein